MSQIEEFVTEMQLEADATASLLELIPDDKLSWKPHPKSMSLGTLGLHIAAVPQGIADMLAANPAELPGVSATEAESREQILDAHTACQERAADRLRSWNQNDLDEEWILKSNGHVAMRQPRRNVVRSLMMNHVYHHRGQLTVYLRMLNIPIPGLYGPSADEQG